MPRASTPVAGGGVRVGGVVSTTVTVELALAWWPRLSVPCQVTVVSPSGKIAGASLVRSGAAAESRTLTELSQTAMSLLVIGEPPGLVASAVSGAGVVIAIVVVAPLTVTVEVLVEIRPAASVDVQVTVVVPLGKIAGASLVRIGFRSTSSVAEAPPSQATMAGSVTGTPAGCAAVATSVIGAGTEITGGDVSAAAVPGSGAIKAWWMAAMIGESELRTFQWAPASKPSCTKCGEEL